MAIIERIITMRSQGMNESQIIQALQQEGISPREIHEAISQSNVKSAIGTGQSYGNDQQPANPYDQVNQPIPEPTTPDATKTTPTGPTPSQNIPTSQYPQQTTQDSPPVQTPPAQTPKQVSAQTPPTQDTTKSQMRPSIMPSEEPFGDNKKPQIPKAFAQPPPRPQQTQAYYQPYTAPAEASYPEYEGEEYDYPTPDQEYTEGYQEGYPEYQYGGAPDIETINDIAEQIVEEKNVELQNQISKFSKFRKEIALEVERMSERLRKVESAFNDLQMAIITKIGDYGRDIKNISKEMKSSQDSFSKVIDPLTENIKELRRLTRTETEIEKNKKL